MVSGNVLFFFIQNTSVEHSYCMCKHGEKIIESLQTVYESLSYIGHSNGICPSVYLRIWKLQINVYCIQKTRKLQKILLKVFSRAVMFRRVVIFRFTLWTVIRRAHHLNLNGLFLAMKIRYTTHITKTKKKKKNWEQFQNKLV